MHGIVVERQGGPEVLRHSELDDARPGRGEVLVDVRVAGVNYLDVYHRSGAYAVDTPFVPGVEAAGIVVELGEGAEGPPPGTRVAYEGVRGAYAERQAVPAGRLVRLPDAISFEQAAAAMLQGMTAHYLAHDAFPLRAGHVCLVHAAAGGTGRLLVQMAKRRGARVIATVSTEEKASIARAAGADEVVLYSQQDFVDAVRRSTGGRGVDVVYDGVGRATFLRGLDALRARGTMVAFGAASGAVEPFDLSLLAQKGSLFLTRPSLAHYAADPEELRARAGDVLTLVGSGELELRIDTRFPLARAADAHRRLESRASSGKLLLVT